MKLADFKEQVYFYHLVSNIIVVRFNDQVLKSLKDSKKMDLNEYSLNIKGTRKQVF